MAVNPNTVYFRYSVAILYIVEATIVAFILLSEIRTFYYSLYQVKTTLQMFTSNVKSADTSVNSTSPKSSADVSVISSSPKSTTRSRSESTRQQTYEKREVSKPLFILPALSYIFYILTGLCGSVSVLGINVCELFAFFGPPSFSLAKMFNYFVFIYRLKIVYGDSAFAYNNKIFWVLFVVVTLFTVVKIILNQLTMTFEVHYNDSGQRLCAIYSESYMIAYGALFDVFISIFCCCLFIRPLLILNKQEMQDRKCMKNRLYDVILKYLILTAATVGSSIILATFMAILKFSSLIAIDMIINCICILLFNIYYNYYYKIICCGPIACCKLMCKR